MVRACDSSIDPLDVGQVRLVDSEQMARVLGISARTLSRLEADGLPVLRVGRAKRYVVKDVLDHLKPIWKATRTACALLLS